MKRKSIAALLHNLKTMEREPASKEWFAKHGLPKAITNHPVAPVATPQGKAIAKAKGGLTKAFHASLHGKTPKARAAGYQAMSHQFHGGNVHNSERDRILRAESTQGTKEHEAGDARRKRYHEATQARRKHYNNG